MVKSYYLRFGSGNPALYSGLSPTFTVFQNALGSTTPPAITELGSTGLYTFDYECTGTIAFTIDGATTGLIQADRYVNGSLDIIDRENEFIGLVTDAAGFSSLFGQVKLDQAIGTSIAFLLGDTTSLIGDDAVDPTTVFGFLKRCENWLEGQSEYTKGTGALLNYDKTGATLLSQLTIDDTGAVISKT